MAIEAKSEAPVLVVDDDPKIQALVQAYLQREGLQVVTAADGAVAIEAIRRSSPQLVVLDLMLPGLDGMSVLRQLRAESDVPVLILSARGSTADRVYGMSEGADDYLPKPFSPAELVARIKAILRRTTSDGRDAREAVLNHKDLTIDLARQLVLLGGHEICLTTTEFRLLWALVVARGRVLSRQQLQDAVYGDTVGGGALDRTIDVHIGRLRAKLGDDAVRPRYIATVRGGGYRAVELA